MGFEDWKKAKYGEEEEKKKRKYQSFTEYVNDKDPQKDVTTGKGSSSGNMANLGTVGFASTGLDLAPIQLPTSLPVGNSGSVALAPTVTNGNNFIADSKNKLAVGGADADVIAAVPEVQKDDKWINTSAFDDGYQFGDISKVLLGTTSDLANNAVGGVLEMGEAVVDTGAWAVGGVADLFGADKFAEDTKEFIASDLYKGEEVAKYLPQNWILGGGLKLMGVDDADDVSLMGEKFDSLAQSGGQLGSLVALQMVGVPAWLTTTTQGVTAFGGEVQNAFNNDASYLEAGASSLITAGAEVLTEKISGGIKIGGKTLDEGMDVALATAISDKTVRTLSKLGVDMAGEGGEEVLSYVMSEIGHKLTYESDKDWFGENGVFSSEEAFENFIGGAILGGAADTIKIGVSNKQGKDFTTGLKTETEQKVVDKLYEDAIAEATKDGKEITRAEEKQIYNDILNALERGEISTDVIEEVLGGEDYKTYKNEIQRQQDLDNELNELRNMKSGDMTDIQQERMSELKAMKPNTDMVNALKFGIDEKIRNGIKDTKLVESYLESDRRTQRYQADLAKYDEKRAAIIQKAIDSGILNNSRKTHELVDLIANISADKGVSFDFTNNEKLKESGFALDGKTVNGFVTKDRVTLNVQSKKYLNSVVGHEITHVLEETELYGELQSAVIEYAKAKGEYDSRRRDIWNLYKNNEGFDVKSIDAELTADLVGDYLFTDQDFVNSLSTNNRNIFEKVYDEIKYLCKVATAGSKEARELEKVKRAFEQAYRGESKAVEGASTVAIAFNSEQVKSVANEKPTRDPDIRYSLSECTAEEKKAHNDAVKNHFGKTYSWNETGYVLLDGTRLDLSGKHDGAPGGYRTVDHRDITEALGYDYGGGDYSGSLVQFMSEGNIRIIPECNGINLSVKPTKEQEQALSNYISRNRGEVMLDIDDLNGNTVVSVEYPYGTYYTKVLNDIREWFDNGKKPENAGSYSLTKDGDTPKRYGGWGVRSEDVMLAPTQEIIPKVETPTEETAPITEEVPEMVAPVAEKTPSAVLYNARDGKNGWGEVYGTAQEALNDAVRYTSPELWNAFNEEWDNSLVNTNPHTPILNALIAVQEDVRQETITPMQGARFLSDVYNNGGAQALEGLYSRTTGNLYDRYLEQAKQYETVAPEVDNSVDEMVDEEPPSMREIYGEEYAPIENAYTVEQELDNIRNEMLSVYNEYNALKEAGKDAEAQPLFEKWLDLNEKAQELYNKAEAYKAEDKSAFESLDDADAPAEVEAPYYEDGGIIDPFEDRDIKAVGNRKVSAYMYENPEVKPFFQEEANILLGELDRAQKGERYYTETPDGRPDAQYGAESYGYWTGAKRNVTPDIATLLDNGKGNGTGYTYDEIRDGINDIIEDNGKENNACSKRIEFILNDRLMNGYITDGGYQVEANQAYRDLIKEKGVSEYNEEAFKRLIDDYNAKHPKPAEPIAPIAPTYDTTDKKQIPGQQTMFEDEAPIAPVVETETAEPTEEPKIAEVLPSTPKEQKKVKLWQKIKNLLVDKQSSIEDISLKTKNRELMAKADYMLRSESRAQRHIKNKLLPILERVEATGDRNAYETYAYHLHNIDRMSLVSNVQPRIDELKGKFEGLKPEQIRAIAAKDITKKTTEKTANTIREAREYLDLLEVKNKPVFADEVTADKSREFVKNFEAEHADAREIAEAMIEYNSELRQMLVDAGIISQETADLWAEMYPHYLPIRRAGKDGAAVKVPLDSRKTGVNAPIARAEGGNSDMESLLDVMGSRTEQVYRAIARNSFGIELMNTLNTVTDTEPTSIEEILDSFENKTDELLKAGENGANPTFTVFVDGKRVTFDITEELYDALKPMNDVFKTDVPVMSFLTKIQRGILTQYNPTFIATNAVKDIQDVIVNSQHAGKTYANVPLAAKELFNSIVRHKDGKWITEYMDNGGEDLTYFDSKKQVFKKDSTVKKVLGFAPNVIAKANDFVEKIPRLAEYIASRKNGASVEVAMLDAARVTTNFAAGGDLTKFANRNGFTFLNASVQGFNQQVRNVREAKANGFKGVMQLATKFAIAGLPVMLLNHLLWDDDEEYAELSDYVKDNYYIVAKYGDGKFVRIPKGRALAVIQSGLEQMKNLVTGDDDVDMSRFGQLLVTNLAPNDPLENNVLAPIINVKNNETWYGEELVPTRLQNLPDAEQYDETTDSISKWLGELTGQSPYKINYLLDQYSGGLGDVFLPMLTPESDGGGPLAPFIDKFTTDSTMKNQNVSDFYETVDELTKAGNSMYATEDDILSSKYINSVNADLGELYKQKREIQNSNLSDKEKDKAVREIQKQIDKIAKEGLGTYSSIDYQTARDGEYAVIGDKYWKKNDKGEWVKLDDEQVIKYKVTSAAGDASYASDGENHFRWYVPSEDAGEDAEAGWRKITDQELERQNEITKGLDITPEEYWSNKEEYSYAYDYPGNYAVSKAVGGYEAYRKYSSELFDIKADKDEYGKSISGSRKEKVLDYINNLDADYYEKIILFKSEYNADDTYNYEIIDYLNSREDLSYKDIETILKELGFTVDSKGNIYWD